MAAVHTGVCPMRCSLCQLDPTLKESWGCLQPVDNPIWEYEGDLYYSCPMLWVTDDVAAWYLEYDYAREFGTVPYSQQSYMWAIAYFSYSRTYAELVQEKRDKQMSHMKSAATFRHAHRGEEDGG